MKSIFSYMGDS